MKKAITYLMTLAILIGFTSVAFAKKHVPDKRDVEKEMIRLGGEHYVEDMKIREVGSIEVGDDQYYHIFSARLPDDGGYHMIIYDNTPTYVGFYKIDFEPAEVSQDGIMIDNGVIDPESGAPLYAVVYLDDTGPPARINITGGSGPSTFVVPPEPEVVEEEAAAESESSSSSSSGRGAQAKPRVQPKYRAWDVTLGDMVVHVESAIFVELKDGGVTIKDGKTGRKVTRPVADFSEEDREYMRNLFQ